MTRNRNRKDRTRQIRQQDGSRQAAAAREDGTRKQRAMPVQDLLAKSAATLKDAAPGDAAAILPPAWEAICAVGAAAEILAMCAGTADYRGRQFLAREPLASAVHAMRATPLLRNAATEVNPAGNPADSLPPATADLIRTAIVATSGTLAEVLSQVASGIRPPSTSRACRTAARAARLVGGIYQQPAVPPADDGGAAASRPVFLDAHDPAEMLADICASLREMSAVDPAATTEALVAGWYGFSLVLVLGQYLASRSPDMAVLHDNAAPVWEIFLDAMDAATSLPEGVHGLGLNTTPTADPAMMTLARKGIQDLTLELNRLLPQVAEHATGAADRAAARKCTALAAELADCYAGRLKMFLNPLGRPPGARSVVIRVPRARQKRSGQPRPPEDDSQTAD